MHFRLTKKKLFQPLVTRCKGCGQTLRVVPAGAAVAPGQYTEADSSGKLTCGCGAIGCIRGTHVKAPTLESQPPSAIQRRFMSRLAGRGRVFGPELGLDVVDDATKAELALTVWHGWVEAGLGGLGTLMTPPPGVYELTPAGRRALERR